MILTDTHCHLDFNRFDPDRDEVLERAARAGLRRILVPGIHLDSSRAALALAESHPMLYAAVGVHPNDALTWDEGTAEALRRLARHERVKAIGEIGLDYYRQRAPREVQQRVLREQLALAAEFGLPVVLHMREVADAREEDGPCARDLMSILREWVNGLRSKGDPLAQRPGVLHSFSGSLETAREAIRLGFYIGVTGPVTFKNAQRRQQIVAQLPPERLLVETDAPFLAPHPYRGRRNEPSFVRWIVDKIAQLHFEDQERVAAITTANAERLFSWGEQD
ncbi:MAG: TatD family deoxyribonuclease [Anaerolineae bacterium]|nr:MAG: TatD family deoxyribonuclease [Anaerolineae bacterium]